MEIPILLQLIFAALLGTAGSVIAQKYIETHAPLIITLCIIGMVIIGGHGIYRIYSKDIFKVTSIIQVRLKWPGPLVFCYPSASGKNLSPISVALFVEVVNNKDVISRISSYECRALLEYDEGGNTVVNHAPNGGIKLEYKPAGKTVTKWRNLYGMGFVDNQVYYITDHDWRKCKRVDFRNNGFDRLAKDTQLNPGESLKGWMFFELEHDLRGQLPEIKKVELTFTNSVGESQSLKIKIKQNVKDDNDMVNYISSGEWILLEGYHDLTKEKYTMTPMVDLRRILKTGKSIIVNP